MSGQATLPATQSHHDAFVTTGGVSFRANVQPAGTRHTTGPGLDGVAWHEQETGHFLPIPPESAIWDLDLEVGQAQSLKIRLEYNTKFPRLAWLEPYFQVDTSLPRH